MKVSSYWYLANFWIKTVLLKKKDPIVGSIIITDRCNLRCKHCSVNNITEIMYPFTQIKKDMQTLYDLGVRILFLYGGEPFLWKGNDLTVRDLVVEAKKMGFMIVNVVTNGTFPINLPEADLILVSLDGDKERHNAIRGNTYDTIMANIKNANVKSICLYMAINKINKDTVEEVCRITKETENVKAVSFNFHTPYPDTKDLLLSVEEKRAVCEQISQMKDEGFPIFNLKSAFPYLINNTFPTPCHQSLIIENGKISVCGRCIDVPGLCEACGYFFVAEYTLLFKGNLKITLEALKTYSKYI